ncbi:MAG: GHKL domain-containing protein [Desulfocapsa sp.]|nr:GHKL domain-containing protein [Desulfocapsa sp.]
MSTLKFQLALTLSVLFFISMFLFGYVMLMLWQRNGIQQEIMISENLLHVAAASLATAPPGTDTPDFSKALSSYFQESGILCLQWQDTLSSILHSHGSCPAGLNLVSLLQDAATNGTMQTSYSGMSWNGFFLSKQYLLMAAPLHPETTIQGSIALVRSLEQVSSSIYKARKIFFVYLVINVLIFTTLGFTRLIHLVIKPIQRLSALADSRTELDDTSFFQGEGLGEFSQLSLSLNRLVTRIDGDKQELRSTVNSLKKANEELQRNRDEMIRTEKLASIGRLSAGLAHEIGNPLGIIQGYIDLLTDESLSAEERQGFSKRAIEELNRINTLIRNLLDLSRVPVTSPAERIDLHELLNDLLAAIRIRKTAIPINYSTRLNATDSKTTMDSDGIRQVFLNCMLNSIDAIEEADTIEQGIISLSTENETGFIKIILTDNGTGIKPELQDAIFDPFFTTKEVGKGTGLGLAVAHNLIKKSGGHIHLSSKPGIGTTVTITLPLTGVEIDTPQQGSKA